MEQVVGEARDTPAVLGDQGEHRLGRIEESRPGGPRDLLGERGRTLAAVERVIAIPERTPTGVVAGLDGTDADRLRHRPNVLERSNRCFRFPEQAVPEDKSTALPFPGGFRLVSCS